MNVDTLQIILTNLRARRLQIQRLMTRRAELGLRVVTTQQKALQDNAHATGEVMRVLGASRAA